MTEPDPKVAAFEQALINWAADRAASDATRDGLVLGALGAGIPKHRIHVLTGLSRSTIDRIVSDEENEEAEAMSMIRQATDVACPKCGSGQGEKCRTMKTNRTTDTHEARYVQMQIAMREGRRYETPEGEQ